MPLSLTFVAGMLELRGLAADAPAPAGCLWDLRAACYRAPAIAYAELVRALVRDKVAPWQATPAVEILDLPGHGVCIPDLTFEHARSGERVHLEVLGYRSRDAVWKHSVVADP